MVCLFPISKQACSKFDDVIYYLINQNFINQKSYNWYFDAKVPRDSYDGKQ